MNSIYSVQLKSLITVCIIVASKKWAQRSSSTARHTLGNKFWVLWLNKTKTMNKKVKNINYKMVAQAVMIAVMWGTKDTWKTVHKSLFCTAPTKDKNSISFFFKLLNVQFWNTLYSVLTNFITKLINFRSTSVIAYKTWQTKCFHRQKEKQ